MVPFVSFLVMVLTLFTEESSGASLTKRLLLSLQDAIVEGRDSPTLKSFRSFSCTTREDGLYPDLASGCSLYYRCLDGAVYSYSCPSGKILTSDIEECRPEEEVSCPKLPPTAQPCVNQSDGFYPHYSQDCRTYYRCKDKTMSGVWWCDEGSTWDISTGSCTTGGDVSCNPPSCWGLSEGPHPYPSSNCNAYFTCTNGVRTDHVCPYQTVFDYYRKQCVPSSSSVCYEQACVGRINGLYSVPNAPCHVYLRCFNGALVNLESCPRNHVFDGHQCIMSTNFSCWDGGRGSCQGMKDGYHTTTNTECRGFYFCRYQQQTQSFRCSQGLVFNGQECVKGDNFICNSQDSIPDCTNKLNGFYTVERTACKSFYLCQEGKKISEHTCPGNNMFDGEQCVDRALHHCSDFERIQQPSNLTNRVTRSF